MIYFVIILEILPWNALFLDPVAFFPRVSEVIHTKNTYFFPIIGNLILLWLHLLVFRTAKLSSHVCYISVLKNFLNRWISASRPNKPPLIQRISVQNCSIKPHTSYTSPSILYIVFTENSKLFQHFQFVTFFSQRGRLQ